MGNQNYQIIFQDRETRFLLKEKQQMKHILVKMQSSLRRSVTENKLLKSALIKCKMLLKTQDVLLENANMVPKFQNRNNNYQQKDRGKDIDSR